MPKLSLSLAQLHNMELANFTTSMIDIAERNNPIVLKLTESFNLLKNAEQSIYLLSPKENGLLTEATYKANRRERRKCILALKNEAKSIYDLNVEGKKEHIQVLYPVIKASFTNYYRKNIVEQNEIARQFLSQIDNTPGLADAVEALGMQNEIEQLRNIQETFTVKYESVRKTKSEYVRKDTPNVRKELRTVINDFFTSIYLAKKYNTQLDYSKLENELSVEIQRVKQILNERKPAKKKADTTTAQQ